ncbi:hypothetical protein L914_14416 [Phytophthora nicotianae]|uniref:Uncharacterized protein n=1 Tax=Phytophthora nicotianae TaxID=4792 RepID=W2MSW9_PHYNI|nr:hypothetical protein L916_14476 [Phytophthora nicotianae]ETM39436.1 hypothetical protein L914_14416 [Phytophthora nicotianae]
MQNSKHSTSVDSSSCVDLRQLLQLRRSFTGSTSRRKTSPCSKRKVVPCWTRAARQRYASGWKRRFGIKVGPCIADAVVIRTFGPLFGTWSIAAPAIQKPVTVPVVVFVEKHAH